MTSAAKNSIRSDLREAIDLLPTVRSGNYPTPLQEMKRLRAVLGDGCPRLFVKRDDLTGTAFGSNKLRKLDFAIGAEIQRGTEAIVTIGGERSNHARVTAAVCARLGLKCVLVLNSAESDTHPAGMLPASRYIYELLGAEIQWVKTREQRETAALERVQELNGVGIRASYLPLGVSFPLGALGFVRAVVEIEDQFEAFDTFPDVVCHASTSGGTQAGLIVGMNLLGRSTEIIGVSPDDPAHEVSARVAGIASGTTVCLGTNLHTVSSGAVRVIDSFIGGGYGVETEASTEALSLAARNEGLILDHTYTAKAFAAMLDLIRSGHFDRNKNLLFWHTGGQLAPFFAPV